GSRLRSLRTAWTHYLEMRRKDKMRREVIRKHAQKDVREGDSSLPRVRKAARPLAEPENAQSVSASPSPLSFDEAEVSSPDVEESIEPAVRGQRGKHKAKAVGPAPADPNGF